MSKSYPRAFGRADGWSDWYHLRQGYQMACCDCGLVHRFQVKVAKKTRARAKPGYIVLGAPVGGVCVFFRAQRNNRASAQLRRHRHPK